MTNCYWLLLIRKKEKEKEILVVGSHNLLDSYLLSHNLSSILTVKGTLYMLLY